MPGDPIQIGPWVGGLNTYSDQTAVADNQAVIIENLELDLDGSLVSRPPIIDLNVSFPLGSTGNMKLLGYYYAPGSVPYLLASDELSSTYYYTGTNWVLLTNTIAASAMVQFDGKAWMLAPVGSVNPGGYWTPAGGFVADANMPRGSVITQYKFRLWVAIGLNATANGTRMYFSKVLGTTPFWPVVADFIDVGSGDGQNIVNIVVYFQSLTIFRTNSTFSFQYTSDPAAGISSLILPGTGLADRDAIVAYQSYLYFMYKGMAFEFVNNRATQINVSVPFRAINQTNNYKPFAVSILGNRAIFSYYDTMFVFSLSTRTWTTWISPTRGSIGKSFSLGAGNTLEQAILHSSQLVPASTTRINLLNNPSGRRTLTGYAILGAGTIGQNTTADTYALSSASQGSGNFGLIIESTTVAAKLIAGQTYTFSATVTGTATSAGVSVQGAGVASGGAFVTTPPFAFARVSTTFVAAASGAVSFYILNGAAVVSGNVIAFYNAMVEAGGVATTYFDGSLVATVAENFAWTGAVDNSTSTAITRRYAKTLRITDGLTTDAETFQCTLLTKNYNYNASGAHKRLFLWGADVIFRNNLVAIVTPVSYNYAVTWGQLRAFTWGQAKNFTWAQPITGTLSVSTTIPGTGGSAIRKFVKLGRSVRFRQANFKMVFDTDGSTSTAPVRIFSLTTYVKVKERVVKTTN